MKHPILLSSLVSTVSLLLLLATPTALALPVLTPIDSDTGVAVVWPASSSAQPVQIALDDGVPPEDVEECEGDECEGVGGSAGPPDIED